MYHCTDLLDIKKPSNCRLVEILREGFLPINKPLFSSFKKKQCMEKLFTTFRGLEAQIGQVSTDEPMLFALFKRDEMTN